MVCNTKSVVHIRFGQLKQWLSVCQQLDQQKEISSNPFYKNPEEYKEEEEDILPNGIVLKENFSQLEVSKVLISHFSCLINSKRSKSIFGNFISIVDIADALIRLRKSWKVSVLVQKRVIMICDPISFTFR